MARITVEDCLENEKNRFSLVMLASKRAKQLLEGKQAVSDTRGNRAVVSALREIADGKVKFIKREVEDEVLRDESNFLDNDEDVSTEETTVVVDKADENLAATN